MRRLSKTFKYAMRNSTPSESTTAIKIRTGTRVKLAEIAFWAWPTSICLETTTASDSDADANPPVENHVLKASRSAAGKRTGRSLVGRYILVSMEIGLMPATTRETAGRLCG